MKRLRLDDMSYLSPGKRARMYNLLYNNGPGNGTLLVLPIDQGLEHGPIDMLQNPPSLDPEYQWKLAEKGNFSGIALHLGLAEKYIDSFAGKVPLILKLNGKTNIPPADEALSPMTGSVEDAVRLGATAVGYTLYVGSPRQFEDINQFRKVKADADRFGMPVILWSYPRGREVQQKGGQNSLYAVDYAARVANELGADVAKLNAPYVGENQGEYLRQPEQYQELTEKEGYGEAIKRVVTSAGKTMVLLSGGSKVSDGDLLDKVKVGMSNGVTGLIFGRNLWQREWEDSLRITEKIHIIMKSM